MTKAEIEEYAKKAVKVLKNKAIEDIGYRGYRGGEPYRAMTTAELMRALEIPTASYSDRSSILSRLTIRLKEAQERGLVKRVGRYSAPSAWLYSGPEVDRAMKKLDEQKSAVEREAKAALKKLGLRGKKRHCVPSHERPHEATYTITHRELLRIAGRL